MIFNPKESKRYNLIDAVRGLTVISMVAFHFCYDLFMVYGVDPGFYHRPINRVWQQSICISFILISGFVLSFGKNSVRRGITVFVAGGIISAVTFIFMPSEAIIWGVLSFLGASMILTGMVKNWFGFIKRPGIALSVAFPVICLILFFVTRGVSGGYISLPGRIIKLPAELYDSSFGIMWGFIPKGFRSSDYFPMFPWYFMFLTGYFISRLDADRLLGTGAAERLREIARVKVPILSALGRRALIVYMIHQPLCMAVLWVIFALKG